MYQQRYYTPYQLKLPVDLERKIEIFDPVYTFCEVIDHIDPRKYLTEKDSRLGRKRYDEITLLKVILFAYMEEGYVSTRRIEKLCKTDIRFMWLLEDQPAPSHMTVANFMNHCLAERIDEIFSEINAYLFATEKVDLQHLYIDGTKLRANANMYSWVWKKSCIKNRDKLFLRITELLKHINEMLLFQCVCFDLRREYAIEYLELVQEEYLKMTGFDPRNSVSGKGKHKSQVQRYWERLESYVEKLKRYSKHIKICGEDRNSFSKTDPDATFMRMKRDHMKNDQLLPAFNVQMGICDEYVAVFDVKQYASDTDCFVSLVERFVQLYGFYPKYPVADAGYGSFNNYLYCQEHGMEKYMKFSMYEKESKDEAYQNDPYRAVNFSLDEEGCLLCPGNKRFHFVKNVPIKNNRFGRTEEYYQCENCEGCEQRENCFRGNGNRIVRLNRELTQIHQEVRNNLNSVHGALLRMNRSIQAEGVFGSIKWNRSYTRARRRGLKGLKLEIGLISCGFNLHKYHLKSLAKEKAA
ncbi:MAG: IS1182 family transposase [Ruminococcaceae bacterium]|nr:IS1182 family transposase [Oscillospiraceae bacterium]